MADRKVTHTRKDPDGDILALAHPGEHWSPRSLEAAIEDIDNEIHRYYVMEAGYETDVAVITREDGVRYLRTEADVTSRNNLDSLPDW